MFVGAVNIQVFRLFTRIRKMPMIHKDLLLQLERSHNNSKRHAGTIAAVFNQLSQMKARQEETDLLEEIRRGKAKCPDRVQGGKRAKGWEK